MGEHGNKKKYLVSVWCEINDDVVKHKIHWYVVVIKDTDCIFFLYLLYCYTFHLIPVYKNKYKLIMLMDRK